MMVELFPVHPDSVRHSLLCPLAVPWDILTEHEAQFIRNHGGQSLIRLSERGGLGIEEMYYGLRDERPSHVSYEEALSFVLLAVSEYLKKSLVHEQIG